MNISSNERPRSTQPVLTGRRVRLRPLGPNDYDWLYAIAVSERVGYRWRFRGMTPSPDEFVQFLWRDTPVQFIIEELEHGKRVGLVQLYNFSAENGVGYLAVVFDPSYLGQGWPIEGVYLFVDYLFVTRNLRKLYLEATDLTVGDFRSAIGPLLVEEGRLRQHQFHAGDYIDAYLFALYRESWLESRRGQG